MNVHFPPEFIEKIKHAVPIIDLASEYFKLEKLNDTMYRANCKHRGGDKTPSLTFYTQTNTFYCYSCHAGRRDSETEGSDIICFIRWMEGLSWQESIIYIARLADIQVPQAHLSEEDKKKIQLYNNLLNENRIYWNNLEKATKIKDYFRERGFFDEDVNKFRLGAKWCPEVKDYRPVYAIMDEQGRTVAFSTRLGIEGTKYKNSATSDIYKKKELLYGLNFIKKDIREKGFLVLVEGQNDTIQCQKYGVPACAGMGTAITDEHIQIIKRYTDTVVIFFDGDKAGEENAISNGLKLRDAGIKAYAVISDGADPDDVSKKFKDDTLNFIEEHKEPILPFIISRVTNKMNKEISKIKMNAISELDNIMESIPDKLDKQVFLNQARDNILKGR